MRRSRAHLQEYRLLSQQINITWGSFDLPVVGPADRLRAYRAVAVAVAAAVAGAVAVAVAVAAADAGAVAVVVADASVFSVMCNQASIHMQQSRSFFFFWGVCFAQPIQYTLAI